MAGQSGPTRVTLFRLIPVAIFVTLGLILTIFVSSGAPAWATPADPLAGTLPIISGTVYLQGRPAKPAPSWSVPLVVTLHNPGNTTPAYTYNTTTDQYGKFVVTHAISGTYVCDIRVKNPHTLRNVKSNVTLVPDDNVLDFGALREGDANNDNYVSLIDFSILATTYDKWSSQPGFDPRADFNENDWIEIADFSLLATNYDTHGDFPVGMPYIANDETVTFTLKLQPSFYVTPRQGIFTIDLRLDPKGQLFHGVAVFLAFNPAELQVVDEAGDPVTAIIPGDVLPVLIANEVNNETGEIKFSAGVFGSPPPSPATEFSLGVIRFKAMQVNLEGSYVTFIVQEYPPKTGVTYEGYYLPLEVIDLRVRIPERRLIWPLFLRIVQTLPVIE